MLIVFNLIVVALVLGLAYLWMTRGFFSAFLHLLCTVAAGAFAFAFWELIGGMILGAVPSSGFARFLHGMSWGLGLLIPFVVAVVVLRLITDKLITANVTQASAVDYAGGLICGLAASTIAVGVLVISISYMRLSTGFLGYQPAYYSDNRNGSIVRKDTLWLPVDSIVSKLYGAMSENTLATSEPLAKWRPNVELTGFASRLSPKNGSGRNTFNLDDFSLSRVYTVGEASTPVRDLLTDTFDETPQGYETIDGASISTGQLIGYVIDFKSGAKEDSKGAQVLMSNGQIHLVAEKTNDATDGPRSMTIFPIAAVSRADSRDGEAFGRWRYDAEEVYIASVGGASTVTMAFEFLLPTGYEPIGLTVKNARVDLREKPAGEPRAFPSVARRDAAITSGALIKGSTELTLDESDAVIVDGSGVSKSISRQATPPGIAVTTRLGYTLDRQTATRGLQVDRENDNAIVGGSGAFSAEESNAGRSSERNFRVSDFGIASDQALVQIIASGEDMPANLLGSVIRSLDATLTPRLVDTNGNLYDAVGWVYEDAEGLWIRFTPSDTIESLTELPKTLSRARSDQSLRLLFLVSKGAEIQHFIFGDEKVILTFEPTFEAE